ncbi:MAG: (Fe-S)-binding protein [Pseudomonadota bacterium]
MAKSNRVKLEDFCKPSEQLTSIDPQDLMPLPPPYDKIEEQPGWKGIDKDRRAQLGGTLDDTIAVGLPRPKTKEEEERLVEAFISGLKKLLTRENNWTFLQPLILTLEHCAKCQTCVDACPIYEASGKNDIYRPTFRAEILRSLVKKYVRKSGGLLHDWSHKNIDLNYDTLSRLLELCYRCTLCRRCTQVCPIGVDNGLVTRELRKIFSQELGIAPRELHENGTVKQMNVGSSTGMNVVAVKDNVEFIDDEMSEKTGMKIKTPWDVEGADVLLLHNAGEFLAWPENPGAFAILLEAAGISWTLSSEPMVYDSVSYGLFYDDAQFARIALAQMKAAKKLGVKTIVLGECGHAHKALTIIADRILGKDMQIPRVSALPFLEEIVFSGKIKFDPSKNDFPVTLHDPCNITRAMGIVEPQRRILRQLAPKFREMEPHGVNNYCCGGGSGLAIMSQHNFEDWRLSVSGRMKLKQILEAFSDCPEPETKKYVCAPCSNCKGQIRDLLRYYGVWEKSGIHYGGLVELIVNAMTDIKEPFLEWPE